MITAAINARHPIVTKSACKATTPRTISGGATIRSALATWRRCSRRSLPRVSLRAKWG
ncbi:MAG: hypothetical protein QOG98_543 [Pseudonocardiales bacterium]|nr:hypothetical protein [Pseudonocardiales bacterium]